MASTLLNSSRKIKRSNKNMSICFNVATCCYTFPRSPTHKLGVNLITHRSVVSYGHCTCQHTIWAPSWVSENRPSINKTVKFSGRSDDRPELLVSHWPDRRPGGESEQLVQLNNGVSWGPPSPAATMQHHHHSGDLMCRLLTGMRNALWTHYKPVRPRRKAIASSRTST